MKTYSTLPANGLNRSIRSGFNPVRFLSPESLTRTLDGFHRGYLRPAALLWESIENRDDILRGITAKRKKSVGRLSWEILTTEDSPEAHLQQEVLRFFYNHLQCLNGCDLNECGGFSLLVKQMMDCIGKKYAVHEIIYREYGPMECDGHAIPLLSADFRFVPLWYFENTSGKLRFLQSDTDAIGVELESGCWLVTMGDGLMEACSIAYLFKHLPLRDWLVYCERNGMPGVKGVTDAQPGSPQWEMAKQAVESFGAEFNTLMSRGSNIEAIDLSAKGELPYPALIDRMDRAMVALWCGSDLATLSRSGGSGASLQSDERLLLEQDDAALISETLNIQVDQPVLRHCFGDIPAKAYIRLKPSANRNLQEDLAVYERLWKMGLEISKRDLREHFGLSLPDQQEELLKI